MAGAKQALPTVKQVITTSLTTVALSSLGTLALVTAHHLGRKQYDKQARFGDYGDGVRATWQQLTRKTKATAVSPSVVSPSAGSPCWISGVADLKSNDFGVVGINRQRQVIWQTTLPERVHDILLQPRSKGQHHNQPAASLTSCHVAVMGRRPSEYFWILDSSSGAILHQINAQADRHFYGHGCYSLDGKMLYVTENNTATYAGKIGVYDVAAGYKKVHEFAAYGIGPHEIVVHSVGDSDTLVIANGGIKTERASRDELNLDTMQPSLVYVNRHTGQLLEQVYPEHNQMSVRHLAMHHDGTVAIGIQFQGERHLNIPLVLTHKRGDTTFTPLQLSSDDNKGWHRFHHYIASIAVDSKRNLIAVTSPIGGCAAVFDLTTTTLIDTVGLPDCAGVAVCLPASSLISHAASQSSKTEDTSFIISDGQGYLTKLSVISESNKQILTTDKLLQPFAFDNHLKQL